MKVEFPYWTRYGLYMLHNRIQPDARVFVWTDGARHRFTVGDTDRLPHGRWECLGRLQWVVDAAGQYFEHHLLEEFPSTVIP